MNILAAIQHYFQHKVSISEKPVVEAYDLWSRSYDTQPGNLMLDLDALIFTSLTKDVRLENKSIADIGCGTGRHWQMLFERHPARLIGYDVSAGMLNQLTKKFPEALTKHVTDNLLSDVPASSVDCIVSTLTIAHIHNLHEAVASWARILKTGGDVILTDFHPALLEQGGKRSFVHGNKTLSVENYVHPLEEIKKTFFRHGFTLVKQEQRYVDDSVRAYYEAQQRVDVFNKFKGMPVIYGLYLKK